MFFAAGLKRSIYVCSQSVNEDGVAVYAEPKEYRVNCHNVLPTSASADLNEVGTSYLDTMQILGDPEYLRHIKPFDKVYVNVGLPSSRDPLAKGADFYVRGITYTPLVTRILLNSLSVDHSWNG